MTRTLTLAWPHLGETRLIERVQDAARRGVRPVVIAPAAARRRALDMLLARRLGAGMAGATPS